MSETETRAGLTDSDCDDLDDVWSDETTVSATAFYSTVARIIERRMAPVRDQRDAARVEAWGAQQRAQLHYANAIEWRDRAHVAEAELSRLRAAVEAVQAGVEQIEGLAQVQAISCRAQHRADHERNWLDVLAIIERMPAPVSSSGEAESEPLNVGVLADFVEVGRPGGEGGWVCSTCGYGSTEHGMTGHPSFACVYQPAWKPLTPAPVLSGGQADGEGEPVIPIAYQLGALADWCDSQRTSPTTADLRALAALAASTAARPVLSRVALRGRLDGHWPIRDEQGVGCGCGWEGDGTERALWRDHLAAFLVGQEER